MTPTFLQDINTKSKIASKLTLVTAMRTYPESMPQHVWQILFKLSALTNLSPEVTDAYTKVLC